MKKSKQKNIYKKNLSLLLAFLIIYSNSIPVVGVYVLAEGEEQPTEIVVQESVPQPIQEQVTEESTSTETSEPTSTTIPENGSVEESNTGSENNIETSGEQTNATSTGTTTPIVGFELTSTTTTGTTTILHNEEVVPLDTFASSTIGTSTQDIAEEENIVDEEENTDENATGTLPVGTSTIETGDAVATANILNILNTNSINSTGTIQMVNLNEGIDGDLDLRGDSQTTGTSTCSVSSCNGVENIQAKISDDANIDNVLALQAGSGGNTVQTSGGGVIDTGNTFAGLNLVNIANTNIIDSNYFLLTLNSFSDVNGDIILPSLSAFLGQLIGLSENTAINTNSSADVVNNLDVNANTGENNATNTKNAEINSGDASTFTNIYNSINTNLFGGRTITLLLRVTGEWLGEVLGLPEGQTLQKEGTLYSLQITDGNIGVLQPFNLNIESTSTAKINNDVKMLADSGKNNISYVDDAIINTGDSVAAANVINIANTNVVGKNWILAIINIFGNFKGNISFGRPDLWIGQQVSANSIIQNDTILNYKISVINKGDVTATLARVTSQFDQMHLKVLESDSPYVYDENGYLSFNLGNLESKQAKEISFSAKVYGSLPGEKILNTSTVTLREKDNNLNDNTDSTEVGIYSGGGGGYSANTQNISPTTQFMDPGFTGLQPNIKLSSNNFLLVRSIPEVIIKNKDEKIHQKVVLRNLTDKQIEQAIFDDVMYDENGKEVQRESWDLGVIAPREEIEMEYDISLSDYLNAASFRLGSELHFDSDKKIYFGDNGKIVFDFSKPVVSTIAYKPGEIKKIAMQTDENIGEKGNVYMFIPATSTLALSDNSNNTIDSSGQIVKDDWLNSRNVYYLFLLMVSALFSSLYFYDLRNQRQ